MESSDLARMRSEYAENGLTEATAGGEPLPLFQRWMAEAISAELHEPNAMALATATPDGIPSVRIVLLKGIGSTGAVFFTNYDSRKGAELADNPRASAVMLWHPLQRQVRIEGHVRRVSAADSDAYFLSRPHGSQIGAVASPQSQVVKGRKDLEKRYAAAEDAYGDAIPRPEHWGGYVISLDSVEFWQGRANRMHDRIKFIADGDTWRRDRLAP